jgi:hypothetical protein
MAKQEKRIPVRRMRDTWVESNAGVSFAPEAVVAGTHHMTSVLVLYHDGTCDSFFDGKVFSTERAARAAHKKRLRRLRAYLRAQVRRMQGEISELERRLAS